MGTTHNHDLPAATTLGEADQYPTINASTTRGAYVTAAQMRAFMAGGMVTLTADATLTAASHAGRTMLLGEVGGNAAVVVTLPVATGTGNKYRFVVSVVNTSGYTIEVADATDIMYGNIISNATGDAPDLTSIWPTAADSDTITLDGTTTGGVAIGDWIEVQDILLNGWAVTGIVTASGAEATPFSAAV